MGQVFDRAIYFNYKIKTFSLIRAGPAINFTALEFLPTKKFRNSLKVRNEKIRFVPDLQLNF